MIRPTLHIPEPSTMLLFGGPSSAAFANRGCLVKDNRFRPLLVVAVVAWLVPLLYVVFSVTRLERCR